MAEDKKIIVDEDWKQKAQQEKEQLKEKKDTEKTEDTTDSENTRNLPKGDLKSLLSMLATQAMFAMGLIGEEGAEPKKDMQLAKFQIDIIESLEEKTKGNLSTDEEKMLKDMLSQLRMTFVSVSSS